jgi:hypothetical protein
MGEIIVVLTLAAATDPRVRNLETELPDVV